MVNRKILSAYNVPSTGKGSNGGIKPQTAKKYLVFAFELLYSSVERDRRELDSFK